MNDQLGPNVPESVLNSAIASSRARGYRITNAQRTLPLDQHQMDPGQVLFELTPEQGPSSISISVVFSRLAHTLSKNLRADLATFAKNPGSLVALTEDGRNFSVFAPNSHVARGIHFLPYCPGNDNGRRYASLEDLQPIFNVYEMRQLVGRLSDAIFAAHGHDRLKLFDSLLLLLAAKIYDEMTHPHDLQWPRLCSLSEESSLQEFTAFCDKALERLMPEARNLRMHVDAATLKTVLKELLPYSIRVTVDIGHQVDVLGTFYQEVVSSTFRGSLGAYFTPRTIIDLATQICRPQPGESMADFSSGSGEFLTGCFESASFVDPERPPVIFGNDIQERMALTSYLNCLLHGVERPHVICGDGLKVDLAAWHEKDPEVPKEGFSLIVGNPPFAGYESAEYLPYFHNKDIGNLRKPRRVNKIIPFVVKTFQLLAPGGRAVLVVPTSVLNGESQAYVGLRDWLKREAQITEIISLPRKAFVHTDTGIEGALLFFKRNRSQRMAKSGYVFVRKIHDVGYDNLGRPTRKNDIPVVVEEHDSGNRSDYSWIPSGEFAALQRWDPVWVEGSRKMASDWKDNHFVHLRDLCTVIESPMRTKDLDPSALYTYFEVGDTDIDTGEITATHSGTGGEVINKTRLRVIARKGMVLLPNHRDSLIAKTASGGGRSAAIVPDGYDGFITTNRFTVLKPLIDPQVLVFVLNTPFVRTQMVQEARGSASFDVNDKVLGRILFPRRLIDDLKLQETIKTMLQERDSHKASLKDVVSRLHLLATELGS